MNSRASSLFASLVLLALLGSEAAASANSDVKLVPVNVPRAVPGAVAVKAPLLGSVAHTNHPLVAQYTVFAPLAGQVSVEFGTSLSYGRSTASKALSGAAGTLATLGTVKILVAGMRPNTTYHMRARIDQNGRTLYDSDHTFTTGALPPVSFPVVNVTRRTSSASGGGVDLVNDLVPTDAQAVVYDTDGSVIWYYCDPRLTTVIFPIRQLANGDFLVAYQSGVREVDLAGNIVRDVTLSQINAALAAAGYPFQTTAVHHDVLGLDNGHWILLVYDYKYFQDLPGYPGTTIVTADAVVDLAPNNQVAWVWRAFDHLDVNRHPYLFPDLTHSNGLVYLPDGNLLLSMRHQSWVLKLDYANGTGSGDILWRLGFEGDFTLPANANASEWFYNQHFPLLLQNVGSKYRLALYDNGNIRPDATGQPCSNSNSCFSRGVIMDLDESARMAEVYWQYQLPWFSNWGGSIVELPGGYVEIDSSSVNNNPSRVVEVPMGPARPSVVWEMDSQNTAFYRAYRIPSLYPGVTW